MPYAAPAYLDRQLWRWLAWVLRRYPAISPTLIRNFRRVDSPLPDMEVSLWLLTHPDLRRVARTRTVLDFLAYHLGKRRALIEGREQSK